MSTSIYVDTILFDMDGTLVDSTLGVEYAWHSFAKTYPGLDVKAILSTAHGIRTVENLKNYCDITDEALLQSEAARFETEIVNGAKAAGNGIAILPGASEIINQISKDQTPENPGWAICTSATTKYATAALGFTGIQIPSVFVTADHVARGKPMPDPYLLGAEKAGVDPKKCLVIEDAPAGILSGRAAGCKVLALLTTHSRDAVEAAQPDFIVPDLTWVEVIREGGSITVNIRKE